MEQKHVTFEEWWEAFQKTDPSSKDIVRAAFNAGRTEGYPRAWRYTKKGGRWYVEFLDKISDGKDPQLFGDGPGDHKDVTS